MLKQGMLGRVRGNVGRQGFSRNAFPRLQRNVPRLVDHDGNVTATVERGKVECKWPLMVVADIKDQPGTPRSRWRRRRG